MGKPVVSEAPPLAERYHLLVHVPRNQCFAGSRGGQSGKTHIHVREQFDLGRIHRSPGHALCGRRGWYERVIEFDGEAEDICPRCAEIAGRVA